MPKATVEQVSQAFQDFHAEVRHICFTLKFAPGSVAQQEAFHTARQTLKDKLTKCGLADMIDWTPPEGVKGVE